MSREADNPLPPRRPKSSAKRRPPPPDDTGDDGPSTFRPNPNPRKSDADYVDPVDKAFRKRPKNAGSKLSEGRPLDEPDRITHGPNLTERIIFGSVGTANLARFCRQFGAYLDAGVDILKALSSLEKQFKGKALGPVIARLKDSVRKGDPLADAAEREPQAFDRLFVSMIRVAEARGGMPETLRLMAHHYEARLSLLRQARSAMIYPIAVALVASGVVALLTIKILPMFVSLIRDLAPKGGGDLPLPSRILMGFSDFIQALGWWLVPLVMIATPILAWRFYKTKPGKRLIDGLVLWVPVFGKLLSKIDTTRFARTLAALTAAGVDINSSLELTSDVMHLEPYRRAVDNARDAVMDGEELSVALAESHRFGHDVIAIVNSGEETGKLPETLEKLADDYEEQVAYMVRNLGQLMQPLMMIMMGGVVLFIILAVFLPYIAVLTNLSQGKF